MSKKKKPEEPLPKQYAAGSAFSASVLLRPRGESIDVEWPDGGMCAVLTHDEIMHFRNLAAFAALRRGMPSRATLTITFRGDVEEPKPATATAEVVHRTPPLSAEELEDFEEDDHDG